jgi:hypothetical protein
VVEAAVAEKETQKTADLESTLIYLFFNKHSAEFPSVMIVRFEKFQFIRFFLKLCKFPSNLLKFSAHSGLRNIIVGFYKNHL